MLVNRTLPTVVRVDLYDTVADETALMDPGQAGNSIQGLICGPRNIC